MFSAIRRRAALVAVISSMTASLGMSCSKPSADEHLRRGNQDVEQSHLQEAVIEYRLALQADPKRGDIRLKLADTYVRLKDGSAALQEYARAADLLPNDATAQLKSGTLLLMAGRFDDAKARANKMLALDPKSADGQILMGNALAGLKDLDGAIADYQEAIALNPTQEQAYANLGAIQFARGQRTEAEATFRKAVAAAPTSVPARMALANFLWSSGRAPEAEQSLKDALALDPTNLSANRALGMFYVASNRAQEAEPYFQAIAATAKSTPATLSLADYYVVMQRFDDARKILTTLASNPTAYATATTRLAAIDATQGQRAQAESKLREVLDKYPKDASARLLSARLLVLDGKRDEALANANLVATQDPNAPAAAEAYYLIGRIQTSLDRPEEAIKAYEEVLKRQPQPVAADLALAALHLTAGSLDKATTYAHQALAIQPKSPQARALMVRILLAQHKMPEAQGELASLEKEFPTSPTVLNLMAAQQLAAGQVDAARASYLKVVQVVPTDIEATTGIVRIDLSRGRTKDAITRVEDGLKVAAPSGDFLVLAARAYATAGNPAKAEELLKRAIEAEPARLQAYGLLGQLYLSQHRLDDARDQFQQVVTRNPKSIPANTMLGMLLEAQGHGPEAEKQYQTVLTIDPRAVVAANNLAWIYVASNRKLDEALQLAQTAQQQVPDEPHINDTLGWIYYRKNLIAQAVRHLESSVQKDGNDPTTHYHLGMAYEQAGDLDKAKKELQRALAMNSHFEGAADARKALAQIGG
jgi:putative PEP-CTERM system TPR-repeat lipoprotein